MSWFTLIILGLVETLSTDGTNFSRILFQAFSQNFHKSFLTNQAFFLAGHETVYNSAVAFRGHLESSTSVALLAFSLVVYFRAPHSETETGVFGVEWSFA